MSMAERPNRPARGKLSPPLTTDVDPIDARPTAHPATTPPTPTLVSTEGASKPAPSIPALNVTIQSGVAWSPEIEQLVREVKARTGMTRRAIVEEAIVKTWGSGAR